jgi:4-amino-4-deoxy-L-arabinose transferase-like glycosyltransferase
LITVDKPAFFLWPMDISGRIFGRNGRSLFVPQALEGVGEPRTTRHVAP